MKKKSFAAIIALLIILCIASSAIYLRKTYVKIDGHIYKTDENAISSFADFEKLSFLSLSLSNVTSFDSKKISTFSNLKELYIYCTDIYLEGFNNSNLSCVKIMNSDVKNFDSLAGCLSLRSMSLLDTIVDDNIIYSDGSNVMKDSRFMSSVDNVTDLAIYVDSIEDVSGICEMDSLKSLTVSEGSISDEAIDQLDEKGIKVTQKKSDD